MVASRVFITGLSAVTASGMNIEENWQSILNGKSSIAEIANWDLSSWPSRLAGELKEFNPKKMLPDKKLMKVISRQDVIGINAATSAVANSKMLEFRDSLANQDEYNESTAIFVGSPGNKFYQQYDFLPLVAKTNTNMHDFADNLFSEVHPMWLLKILPNNVLAYTGITYGFKGVNHNITNHATGGMQAIIEAYHAIRAKQAKRAVVVAYDVAHEPQGLFYYDSLGLISNSALRPFDKTQDGTILGEGAAALVLESEESVIERGAHCYSEVLGGNAQTEGEGMFSLKMDGKPLARLITKTLDDAEVSRESLSLLIAHGNGNSTSDLSEANAFRKACISNVPVSAFKWAMGHTLCASGLLDTVLLNKALSEKIIPGVATFNDHASECESVNITNEHRVIDKDNAYALVCNRGFGSMDACLLLRSVD